MNKTERSPRGGLAMWRRAALATGAAVLLTLALLELTAVLLLQGKLPEAYGPYYALGCAAAAAFLLGLLRPGGKGGAEAALPLLFLAVLALAGFLLGGAPGADPMVLGRNLLVVALAYGAGTLIKLNKSRKSRGKRKNKKYK